MPPHLAQGSRTHGVLEASKEVQIPRLLAMLCVQAVFVPSFFMAGISRSLFVPLSLAVGFAMAASYFLSSTLVPVLSVWILRHRGEQDDHRSFVKRLRERLGRTLETFAGKRRLVIAFYVLASALAIALLGPYLGREIFPRVYAGQLLL